ncbi:MAG: beta-ketoacyl synthase N-terminal-like domain-containing protein, partial [Candidatus Contubernalis sp.]|nr:beta-ketoacyl synthase N-terminal-like domain-containing protein [Candidatus Contubernalis sp.]
MKNRVVVTGIGVITPIGIGKDAFWEGLKEGRSGVDRITAFDTTDYPVQIAAQVKNFNAEDYMDRKEARRMDRFIQFAVASAGLSLEDSGLDLKKVDLTRVGVSVGSGIGGVQTMEEQARVLMEKGPKRVSPFLVPMMITNMASGCVSIAFGAKGPNTTL